MFPKTLIHRSKRAHWQFERRLMERMREYLLGMRSRKVWCGGENKRAVAVEWATLRDESSGNGVA